MSIKKLFWFLFIVFLFGIWLFLCSQFKATLPLQPIENYIEEVK